MATQKFGQGFLTFCLPRNQSCHHNLKTESLAYLVVIILFKIGQMFNSTSSILDEPRTDILLLHEVCFWFLISNLEGSSHAKRDNRHWTTKLREVLN